jgi:hypothetical protein
MISAMPIALDRDMGRRWMIATATGELTIHEVTGFLRTARSNVNDRMWPLLFDARGCWTSMTDADVQSAVAVVEEVGRQKQRRAHAAIIAGDDRLYRWLLLYEARCTEIGVRAIRVFRQLDDAERWLAIVSAARELA